MHFLSKNLSTTSAVEVDEYNQQVKKSTKWTIYDITQYSRNKKIRCTENNMRI